MIILDTNVVSAIMARAPHPKVMGWLDGEDPVGLHLSAITIAEIVYGIQVLPEGRRRDDLGVRFTSFVERGFDQRILDFDTAAAYEYGEIMAHRRRIGRPMSLPDGQIAAIARCRRMAVATRNIKDFQDCGLTLVNPFESASK